MSIFRKIILSALVVSYLLAVIFTVIGQSPMAKIAGTPAIVLLAWSSLGHFITLDDDMPGEWSNPEGSKKYWRESLLELGAKVVLLIILLVVIF